MMLEIGGLRKRGRQKVGGVRAVQWILIGGTPGAAIFGCEDHFFIAIKEGTRLEVARVWSAKDNVLHHSLP
jgi:hypothetical protein